MIWSFSSDKMFRRCQRQWFYKTTYGNGNAKKVRARREAYLLSKLQTIGALRGNVVDDALSNRLVRSLNRGVIPECETVVSHALELFEQKMAVVREHPLESYIESGAKLPENFAVLFDREYGSGLQEEQIEVARSEIRNAIENLYELDQLLEYLSSAQYLVEQRPLTFYLADMTFRAIPDVIAFFDDEPPIVLDWKVHFFGNADAAKQLACYSLALSEVAPHRDFPASMEGYPIQDTRLWEAQLLTPELRKHEYDSDEYASLEEEMVTRAEEMNMSLCGKAKASDFAPQDFLPAYEPRQCERCPFKRLCWE